MTQLRIVIVSTTALGLFAAAVLPWLAAPPLTIPVAAQPLPVARLPAPPARAAAGDDPSPLEQYRGLERLARLGAEERWASRVRELEAEVETLRRRIRAAAPPRAAPPPLRSPQPYPAAPATTRARSTVPRLAASAARVQLIGSAALVTGVVRNSGTRDATVTVLIELLLDQRIYDRARRRIFVPAASSAPLSHRFHTSLATGTYAARLRVGR